MLEKYVDAPASGAQSLSIHVPSPLTILPQNQFNLSPSSLHPNLIPCQNLSVNPSPQIILTGIPKPFNPENSKLLPRTFLKSVKRCWLLNPSFFINDFVKITFTATLLSGPAEIWFSILEDRNDPSVDTWDLFELNFLNEFTVTRTKWKTRFELIYLRQDSNSIAEYTSRFRSLASCNNVSTR